MKKAIKIGLVVILLLFGISKLLEWVIESRFERLINSKPDRNYNISYEDFDLHTFYTGITLDNVSITPYNKTEGTLITGNVDFAELNGFEWVKYVFNKNLKVEELRFNSPEFVINIAKDTISKKQKKDATSLQTLFSDILSRADLDQFQIKDGSILIKEEDSIFKGEVHKINVLASAIKTDSIQLTHIIPFKLGNLEVEVDSLSYQLNSYTVAKLGSIKYSIANENLDISNVSFDYDKNWIEISKERGIQDDVIEFELKSLSVSGVNFSSKFWNNLDIDAKKMEIDSLFLSMKRNKNLKRPKDVKKDLFKGLVDKIPYNVDLDSINIHNSKILYGELGVGKKKTGVIEINAINGGITNFTTFPERQKEFGGFDARFTARLNDAANMTINIEVPYDKDTFQLHTTLTNMNMPALSSSLVPLLGVEIDSGYLHKLDYKMNASYYGSQNFLAMDYEDLHVNVYEQEDDGTKHKRDLFTALANVAIRHHNRPTDKHYLTATYKTERNIYRSPIQHIVAGALDGVKHIVPARGLQSIFNKKSKVKKRQND